MLLRVSDVATGLTCPDPGCGVDVVRLATSTDGEISPLQVGERWMGGGTYGWCARKRQFVDPWTGVVPGGVKGVAGTVRLSVLGKLGEVAGEVRSGPGGSLGGRWPDGDASVVAGNSGRLFRWCKLRWGRDVDVRPTCDNTLAVPKATIHERPNNASDVSGTTKRGRSRLWP